MLYALEVKPFKPITLLWIAALLQVVWGLVPSASQFVIQEIPVELYIAIRWSISGFCFAAFLTFTKKWRRFRWQDVLQASVIGIFGYAIGSLGTLYGLKLGGVTNFALMGAFNPMITSGVAFVVLRERPRKLFFLALFACVLGLIFLVKGHSELSTGNIAACTAALILGAAFLEAVTFTFSKRLKAQFGVIEYLAVTQLGAAAFMWFLQFTVFHQIDQIHQLTLTGACATIFVSIIACVFCYAILYWLLNHIDGHRLALFDSLHTLSATAFGLILFHESLNPLMIAGGLLLLAGVIFGNAFTG